MEVEVSPKVARFVPLAIPALLILRELFLLIFWFEFDIIYYFNRDRLMNGLFGFLLFIVTSGIKVILGVAALYLAKLYSEEKLQYTKLIASGMFGLFFLTGLLSRLLVGLSGGLISLVLGILLFIAMVTNLVISFIVKDSSATPIFDSGENKVRPLVAFTAPVQNYSLPGMQSVPDQLAALEKLHASGALTDAEFKAAKKKILE